MHQFTQTSADRCFNTYTNVGLHGRMVVHYWVVDIHPETGCDHLMGRSEQQMAYVSFPTGFHLTCFEHIDRVGKEYRYYSTHEHVLILSLSL